MAKGSTTADQAVGLYTYQESFTVALAGLYTFSGSWGTDNCGSIALNSVAVSGTGTTIGGGAMAGCSASGSNFTTPTSFSFSATLAQGTNDLQFNVYNTGSITALYVDKLSATTAAVPEPGEITLLLAGFGALGLVALRRDRPWLAIRS